VSALGHYLEDEGMPTVSISLIRLHSEKIRNPRTQWVPFELGRPLGAPHEPAFQTRVLAGALRLLEAGPGPALLEDFPDNAPGAERDSSWRPAMVLPATASDPAAPARLSARLQAEWQAMAPWYLRHIEQTGRTTAGASGLPISECLELLAAFVCGAPPASPDPALPAVQVLRFAVDDLKACYLEALSAGTGSPSSGQMQEWFWDTVAGRAIVALRTVLLASEDKRSQAIGRGSLIPRAQLERLGLA
jgi:hypothetical protein